MRNAVIALGVFAGLVAINFARAQSVGTASAVAPQPPPEGDFKFLDFLPAPPLSQEPSSGAPHNQNAVPQSSETPCVGCTCPQCCCAPCQCPEPAHPCEKCPRVNNVNPAWGLLLGGTISIDALYNSARPVAPGTPFFLTPRGPFADDTFDIHARETTIYLEIGRAHV